MREAEHELFARCASGFEQVLADELRGFRLRRVRPLRGGVAFFGSLRDAYRACLWSRVATRIQLVIARVDAGSAEELYEGVRAIAWERHIPVDARIAVEAHGENRQLRNTQFTALKVKDAVCDRLRAQTGDRPSVDAHHPDIALNVSLHERKATVFLNLSGDSLHRRGYREEGVQTEAPLKETLAAGLLLAAGWQELSAAGGALVDPMCGSGTLAIEAALMCADVAPGLLRARWGFDRWLLHDPQTWDELLAEARGRATRSRDGVRIVAGDLDADAVAVARANARRAGVEDLISFHIDDAARLERHLRVLRGRQAPGLFVANPPYGQRLLSHDELPSVHAALAAAVEALPAGWHIALITPEAGVDTALGRLPERLIACYNGPIEAWVRLYRTDAPRQTHEVVSLSGRQLPVPIAERDSAQFAARLRKVARERSRWARRAGISCYRIYDADLPDYPLAIDYYEGVTAEGEPERLVSLTERRRSSKVDAQRAGRHLSDATALTAAILDLPADAVILHEWHDDRSVRRGEASRPHRPVVVTEGGHRFALDLGGTGGVSLPLPLRAVRELAAERARDGRVAGLFATSAACMVYAAGAGATSTVTVDASSAWLDVARHALQDNGFFGPSHRLARADVRAWVRDERKAHHRYDLLVCLMPAWLPAQAAGGREWDASRDGVQLLRDAACLLTPHGRLLVAAADGELRFGETDLAKAGLTVEDVSGRVVPHDFERSRDKPRCLLIAPVG